MPKQAASAPSTATAAKAPGKKRSRAVGKGAAAVTAEPVLRQEPSHTEISDRAYALYAARGFRDGDPVHDWLSAEQQLRSA